MEKIDKYYEYKFLLINDKVERRDYIQNWLGDSGVNYLPTDILVSDNNIYIYYNSDFEKNYNSKEIYLGLPNPNIEKGFVYMLISSNDVVELLKEKDNLLHKKLNNKLKQELIYVESFPFGKHESIKEINKIQEYFLKQRKILKVIVYLQHNNRNYAASDFISPEQVIQEAKVLFESTISNCQVAVQGSTHQKEFNSIETSLKEIKSYHIIQGYEVYQNIFDIDYEFFIEDIIELEKLEEVFSYTNYLNNRTMVIEQTWANVLNQTIIEPCRDEWIDFISENLKELDIKEDKNMAKQTWCKLEKELKDVLNKKRNLYDSFKNEINYIESIAHYKKHFREQFYKWLQEDAKKIIKKDIEKYYRTYVDTRKLTLKKRDIGNEI